MKLEDIKPGVVIWNKWEYTIMGRDTGTKSTYYIVTEVGEIHDKEAFKDDTLFKRVICQARRIGTSAEKTVFFDEKELEDGCLRLATKTEIRKHMAEAQGYLEKKILDHKTKMRVLDIELSSVQGKYEEFIEKAL